MNGDATSRGGPPYDLAAGCVPLRSIRIPGSANPQATMANEDNPAAIFCVMADKFILRCPLGGANCYCFKAQET